MTFLEKNNEIKWFKLLDLVVWRYYGRFLHGGKDQNHLFYLNWYKLGLLITQKVASCTHLNSQGHTGIPCKGSPGTLSHHDQLWYDISLVLIKLQKPFWYHWNQTKNTYWLMLFINVSFTAINFHWSKNHNCRFAKCTIAVRVKHLFGFYWGL